MFMLFNLLGFAVSVGCLVLSHDVLGLTSRFDDNISANVVGLLLATMVRFVGYRRFVFTSVDREQDGDAHVGPVLADDPSRVTPRLVVRSEAHP